MRVEADKASPSVQPVTGLPPALWIAVRSSLIDAADSTGLPVQVVVIVILHTLC